MKTTRRSFRGCRSLRVALARAVREAQRARVGREGDRTLERYLSTGSREMDDGQFVVAVGSDDAGVNLKDFIRDQLRDDSRVKEGIDFGVADAEDKTAYPVICIRAAEAVASC